MHHVLIREELSMTDLLRQMLEYVDHTTGSAKEAQRNGNSQEIVFTVNLDGVRYVLVRSYPPCEKCGYQLSPRELEIARLISQGFPNKAVASILEISPWTVATHLRRIFAKLEVNSRTEMVTKIINEGWILKD